MPRVRLDEVILNYEQDGEGTNLVLIHGLGGNLSVWDADVPVFARTTPSMPSAFAAGVDLEMSSSGQGGIS